MGQHINNCITISTEEFLYASGHIGLKYEFLFCFQRQVTNDDVAQEKQVRQLFRDASGDDMQIDAFELRVILNGQFSQGLYLGSV